MRMNLRDLLKKRDISGAQVGRRLGVSRSLVSLWCCGKAAPKEETIADLAKILGVSKKEIKNCFAVKK